MKIAVLLSFFFTFFSLTSCINDSGEDREESKRTILVYIGRDNNLSGSYEDKRDDIIAGWNGKGGNLAIYQDLPDGAKLEIIYRQKQENISKVLYEHRKENSASADVFEEVIKQTIAACPADSYGLIVFSHASGWLPDATLSSPRSVVNDNSDWMNLPDFARVIPDKQFEFIIFEACLMGGIEVAYELKDKTNYILASPAEILSPGFKEIYQTSINKLFLPDADLKSFTNDVYEYQEQLSFSSVTLSLIRTSALYELAEWVRINTRDIDYPEVEGIQVFDRNSRHLFFDFGQHFSRLTDNETARTELAPLIDNCLISKYHTPSFLPANRGFYIKHYSGFTTYINQEYLPYLNQEYKKTKWAQAIAR